MTPKGFVRAFFAYGFGSLVTVIFALVLWALLRGWLEGVHPWPFMGVTWLVVVGIPSCGWAGQNISKTLGIRPQPQLQVSSWRSAPIGGTGVLTDAVRSVLPIAHPEPERAVTLPETYAFLCGSFVFPEPEVKTLLQVGWRRQRAGKGAFARSYWLDGREPFYGSRDMYDAWCSICEAAGFLARRQPRQTGKLVYPPLLALSHLQHSVRRVRMS